MKIRINSEDEDEGIEYYSIELIYKGESDSFSCYLVCNEYFDNVSKWKELLEKFEKDKSQMIKFYRDLYIHTDEETSTLTMSNHGGNVHLEFPTEDLIKGIHEIVEFFENKPKHMIL